MFPVREMKGKIGKPPEGVSYPVWAWYMWEGTRKKTDKLNDQDLFPDADDRTALLFSLWLDRRIPYYQLGESCSMDNDEYRERIQKLAPELKKASFIIYSGLQQKHSVRLY